jgi:hypothetical protein
MIRRSEIGFGEKIMHPQGVEHDLSGKAVAAFPDHALARDRSGGNRESEESRADSMA